MSFKDLYQNEDNILEKLSNKEYADHAKTLQKYGLTNRKHITGHNNNHCQRVNRRTNNQYRTIPYQIWAANNSNKNKSQSGNKIKTYYTTPNFYKIALRTIAMTNEPDLDDPSKSFIIKEPTQIKTQGEATNITIHAEDANQTQKTKTTCMNAGPHNQKWKKSQTEP